MSEEINRISHVANQVFQDLNMGTFFTMQYGKFEI